MKKERVTKEKKEETINVHNDNAMRKAGFLRPSIQTPRDESVWTKTPYEKQALRKAKYHCINKDMHFHNTPRKVSKVRCNLIITTYKHKQFPKTTYSVECYQHEIPSILAKYYVNNKKLGCATSIVKKYSWNGKTYNYNELPFEG